MADRTQETYSHDVGFVNSCYTGSLVIPSILKGILGNAMAGLFGDQLNTLHDTIYNLPHSNRKELTSF